MASYHKWDVKNDFVYVLQFFSLISDGLEGVTSARQPEATTPAGYVGKIDGVSLAAMN